jgi:AcrR family transcriptional regulator
VQECEEIRRDGAQHDRLRRDEYDALSDARDRPRWHSGVNWYRLPARRACTDWRPPAAHILCERGWAGLTTNAVAGAAGASIGSLYRYLPDKLALINAVRRRHFDDVLAVLHAAANLDTPRAGRIAALVDGMIAMHSRHPAAHRVLLEESPRGEASLSAHDLFGRECKQAYEVLFAANAAGAVDDVSVSAQVLGAALAGAVHAAAWEGQSASPVLRRELIALVDSFLNAPRHREIIRSPDKSRRRRLE